RRPDVKKQAVLGYGYSPIRCAFHGWAVGAVFGCLAHASPGLDGLGFAPAQVADRRRRVWDTFENRAARGRQTPALHLSSSHTDDGSARFLGVRCERNDQGKPCNKSAAAREY